MEFLELDYTLLRDPGTDGTEDMGNLLEHLVISLICLPIFFLFVVYGFSFPCSPFRSPFSNFPFFF